MLHPLVLFTLFCMGLALYIVWWQGEHQVSERKDSALSCADI